MKIAICSPNENAYSETFIRAHKNLLKGTIFFYNTGWVPQKLEANSILPTQNFLRKLLRKILRKISIIEYSDAQIGFYNSLKNEKPDVILAEYAVCGTEIFSIAKKLNIPLVIHCHGFDVSHKPTLEKYKEKYLQAFEYASKVIGVSKQMCLKLEELGCPKEKIIYTCCGPNPEFFKVQPEFKEPIALAIGRFTEKKAPQITLTAFAKALAKFPNAKLRMVGDGELLALCKDKVHELKIENSVTFAGVMNPEQIRSEMRSARFFVQHSITDADGDTEGTPVAILEAMAAGLPVVSTLHAGIPDVVINNETGLLSAEGDINSMTNNMISLFEDQSKCMQLGKNSRERIKKYFAMEHHIAILQEALNKAAKTN